MTLDALLAAARAWMDADPDQATRAAAAAMVESGDEGVLREHFGHRLQFGTAGIRGPLGAGPGCMNRLLVRQVSAGLGDYLLTASSDVRERGVVIGYDARYGSRAFAEDTASVLADRGIAVWLYPHIVPTPQLAHAVVELGCAAGVMVTASHNPASDNGYKVYWADGAQIIPPHDRGISDAISTAALGDLETVAALRERGWVASPPEHVLETYLDEVHALRVHPEVPGARLVYTAMHGVGWDLVREALAATPHVLLPVAEQVEPDPDFPTAPRPNPEEPGALDLAVALASREGADAVIASDPDADRLAVAVPDGRGGWRTLSGNEIGVLLAEDLLRHGPGDDGRLVATTVVSTSLLRALAREHGAAYAETLTGFKWIAAAALAHPGRFVMGFEEALGYCLGEVVRDKDGVSAALVMADLVSWAGARGRSLLDLLAAIYRRHGVHVTTQRSIALPGVSGRARMDQLMEGLRDHPPGAVAGAAVVRVRDALAGEIRDLATGAVRSLDLPRSNVLSWDLDDGGRVVARPSGTEPRIKFYFEAVLPMGASEPLAEAEARAHARLLALVEDFMARVQG